MKLGTVGRRVVLAALVGGVPACWAAGLAAPAGAASGDCSQAGRTVTCTFTYTGNEQTFTVPAGVGSVKIDAVGAPGGGVVGGLGGTASATVAVTPGQPLYVEVGGAGTGTAGGFNGGGAAGSSPVSNGEGGGGGASDVRAVSGSLSSRLVVAAGGGGSGGGGNDSGANARGGAADADGGTGRNSLGDANDKGGGAGLAGTTTAGGAFGAGGAADSGGTPGSDGTAGGSGVGGPGGGGDGGAGGGGGGGYYGGGAGGGGGESVGHQAGGGGGGGGSCFALAPVACGAATSTTPSVTITYTLPDTTAPTISISSPGASAAYPLGAGVPASYSCADEAGGSGLATCQGTVTSGTPIDTSTPGAHSFTVTARDNAGNTAAQTVGYTVVGTPAAPSISILSPIAGHTYKPEQRVRARYTCAEGAFGPGLKSCVGTVRSGGLINTQSLGRLKFTVTAISNDGQTSTNTVTYSVHAPKVVSSPRYIVTIEGEQTSWLFTRLVSLDLPTQSCTHQGPLRICQSGKVKAASFTLEAPLTDDATLLSWKTSAKNSPAGRKTIVLEAVTPVSFQKSRTGTKTTRYGMTSAWPSRIRIGGNSTIPTITVTFTGSSLKLLTP